jgi:hypothetical protein
MKRAPFIVSALALSATLVPALIGVTAAGADPLADPAASIAPSFAFTSTCSGSLGSQSALDACISAAVPDFDAARASEGLAPIVLPDDFDTLPVPAQLLALVNVERADRDLLPAAGLSSSLDQLVAGGGDGASTSASSSSLLAVFDWLYDGGPGWSDRHALLADLSGPIVAGASFTNGVPAIELVGSDSSDIVDQTPTWQQISSTITFGVDPAGTSITVGTGKSGTLTATVTSGETALLTVGMIVGAPAWSVAPKTCQTVPGTSCSFTLRFDPPGPGDYPGILAVGDGSHGKTVALAGNEVAPGVSMTLGRTLVTEGHSLTVHGLVKDTQTGAALRGVHVTLQRRIAASYPWQAQAVAGSGTQGKVTFHLSPVGTASYRLAVISSSGTVESKSAPQKVRVAA